MAFIYDDRLVIKDGNADEMLKATRQRDGSVHVEIEDPWAGNSETGFRVANLENAFRLMFMSKRSAFMVGAFFLLAGALTYWCFTKNTVSSKNEVAAETITTAPRVNPPRSGVSARATTTPTVGGACIAAPTTKQRPVEH